MLKIVVPMAGAGSRFAVAGYPDPKPLIPINGVPMIEIVINNLRPNFAHEFIFVCQREHVDRYKLKAKLSVWAPGCRIVELNGLTEGAACTVLAAADLIDNNLPLMIANSDQFVDFDIDEYVGLMKARELDGLIMTMKAHDPKWSFVELSADGFVTRVVEKEVISDEATVGIYNFKKGSDFVAAAREMISANRRVNNEFYVAPVYNDLIAGGRRIGICNIGSVADGMYGLGTPADLDLFVRSPVSRKAVGGAP